MVYLASYKGKGKWGNALIRWWTDSQYSHCEVVVDGWCYSSSIMDGGVRCKQIDLTNGNWDLQPMPWVTPAQVRSHFEKTEGNQYGFLDLLTKMVFRTKLQSANRDFCSEWCADAAGLPDGSDQSPRSIHNLVRRTNEILSFAPRP